MGAVRVLSNVLRQGFRPNGIQVFGEERAMELGNSVLHSLKPLQGSPSIITPGAAQTHSFTTLQKLLTLSLYCSS